MYLTQFTHRLKRNHENSADSDIAELKALVPEPKQRTRRTSKTPDLSPVTDASTPSKEQVLDCNIVPDEGLVCAIITALRPHNPKMPEVRRDSFGTLPATPRKPAKATSCFNDVSASVLESFRVVFREGFYIELLPRRGLAKHLFAGCRPLEWSIVGFPKE